MVILKHKLGFEIKLFTSIGSHLLAEISGSFYKRQDKAESILVDNGVYHLLKTNEILDVKLLLKYAVKNIQKFLKAIHRKDVEIHIVIPDYPFNKKLNWECYKLFKQYFSKLFKNYKMIYVLHGYWEAILDDVDVDLLAVPYNTLSDVPLKDLRGRKCYKLDENVGKYILIKTIEHVKQFGYNKIHLLGATALTIKRIFKPLQGKIITYDNVIITNDFMKNIVSFDSTAFHYTQTNEKNIFRLPSREDNVEMEWLMNWLKSLKWFEIEKI